jgi:Transposase IS200 like
MSGFCDLRDIAPDSGFMISGIKNYAGEAQSFSMPLKACSGEWKDERNKEGLKEILVKLCNWLDITFIDGAICSDQIHMYLSLPPTLAPSHVLKLLNGKSAEGLRENL